MRKIYYDTQDNIKVVKNDYIELEKQYKELINIKNNLLNEIYKQELDFNNLKNTLENRFEEEAENVRKKYQKAKQEYEKEFLEVIKDKTNYFNKTSFDIEERINLLNDELEDIQSKTAAAIEIYKRTLEEKEKENFFKLQLSQEDIEEIKKLREVSKCLRDSEPLNKVI